jgi:hypothetical protein
VVIATNNPSTPAKQPLHDYPESQRRNHPTSSSVFFLSSPTEPAPRDQEFTHHTSTESHDSPIQPTEHHPLLLAMFDFKLPRYHSAHDATFQIPKGIILFPRNLHLNRSIFMTHTQVIQKLPLPGVPYNTANCQALAFLGSLHLPPQPSAPSNLISCAARLFNVAK